MTTDNPYNPPNADPSQSVTTVTVYAGFWVRLAATLIDSVLIMCLTMPALLSVYGLDYFLMDGLIVGWADFLISWVLPAIAVLTFWRYRRATPGKMALNLTIADARTGGKPTFAKLVGRYIAYFASLLPLAFGYLWIAFDERKQGWHDKLAGTVVVRKLRHHGGDIATVSFRHE